MPVTMQNAEDFGAESSIVRFVVPLGTNFNRQGSRNGVEIEYSLNESAWSNEGGAPPSRDTVDICS